MTKAIAKLKKPFLEKSIQITLSKDLVGGRRIFLADHIHLKMTSSDLTGFFANVLFGDIV